jgi:lipopolysaccharide/colanic/teichoic acid biosynthesis glycosyltransferase
VSPRTGHLFVLLKVRTWRDIDHLGETREPPFTTRVGRFLLRTRIDGLSQLFSVLRGDIWKTR